jgi:hypothetical protein
MNEMIVAIAISTWLPRLIFLCIGLFCLYTALSRGRFYARGWGERYSTKYPVYFGGAPVLVGPSKTTKRDRWHLFFGTVWFVFLALLFLIGSVLFKYE